MSPQQLEHFRALIEARLAGTEAAIAKANANAGTVMLDQSSVGRLSRMDAMQQQAMASGLRAVLQRERLRLAAARARLQNGAFGACCQCGADIAMLRLESDPGTPFCAACQEDIEAEGRR
ncbi:MAG: TraR/DksA C4-type zinc finger protein [Sideroxyarcus sp.]|nr:TraR/DksA C4-type zinc finger protein [Sideroxyarcus sp.]